MLGGSGLGQWLTLDLRQTAAFGEFVDDLVHVSDALGKRVCDVLNPMSADGACDERGMRVQCDVAKDGFERPLLIDDVVQISPIDLHEPTEQVVQLLLCTSLTRHFGNVARIDGCKGHRRNTFVRCHIAQSTFSSQVCSMLAMLPLVFVDLVQDSADTVQAADVVVTGGRGRQQRTESPVLVSTVQASAQAGQAVFFEDRAFSERQDRYFRADVRLGYRWELGSTTMEFTFDIQNVTNNQNIFLQQYNPRTNTISTEYQQGFFVVPTFRWTL